MKLIKAHQYIKTLCSLLIILSLWSCERDDICAATTPTTPHLIIRFYNINAIDETKTVRRMDVTAENNPNYIVNDKTIDSIVLPLRVDALDIMNTSRFVLTKDRDYDLDDDPNTASNADIIEVNYTPELIYVSRACGYKSVFNNLSANRETDPNNWIINIEVIKDTINNENAAHINIYH
ncbi:DUF6452 family protein [Gelidibacter japonicus]|uniref:DUF6452 family protein n=1 Tax=Gelidibacter japonicus TaxID=1962232 RepID=UPI003A910397